MIPNSRTRTRIYTCLLFPQVSDPLLEVVGLLLLLLFLLVGGEARLDLVERGALDLHGHAEVALVLAAVDVVEVVDRVLDDAVACLAIIPIIRQWMLGNYNGSSKVGIFWEHDARFHLGFLG